MTQDPRHPQGFEPYQNTNYGNQTMAAPKNSVAAIIGLIGGATSLIPCLGFVTGPIGFIASIIGFFTTGKPNVKGRWMAVLGFILSIVGFVGMNVLLVGGGGYAMFQMGKEAVTAPTETFIDALVANDIAAARAASTGFSDENLKALATQFDAVGDNPEIEFSLNGFNLEVLNNNAVGTAPGTVVGNGATISFTSDVEGSGDLSNMSVTDFTIR